MKIFTVLFLTLLCALCVFGQTVVKGSIDDLKNFSKVGIITESPEFRKSAGKTLRKKKVPFEVVDDPQQADFFLEIRTGSQGKRDIAAGMPETASIELTAYFFDKDRRKITAWSGNITYIKASGVGGIKPSPSDLINRFIKDFSGKK